MATKFRTLDNIKKNKAVMNNLKWIAITGGLAIIIGIAVVVKMQEPPPAEITGVNLSSTQPPPTDEMSNSSGDENARNEQIRQNAEQQRVQEAENKGSSSFHSASGVRFESTSPENSDIRPPELGGQTDIVKPPPEPVVVQAPPPPPPEVNQEALQAYYQAIEGAIDGVRMRRVPAQPTDLTYTRIAAVNAAQAMVDDFELQMKKLELDEQLNAVKAASDAKKQQPGQQQGSNAQAIQPPTLLAGKGDVVVATNLLSVNTDVPGPVTAQIITGPLAGSLLLGQVTRQDERAILTFNNVRLPKEYGELSVGISAISLDANDLRLGNATDVDRHIFLRYGVRPAMAALATAAQALTSQSNRGRTIVLPNGSTVYEQGEGLQGRDFAYVGLGAAAQQLQADINSKPIQPTVRVAPNEMIGVLFLSDVLAPQVGQAGQKVATQIHPSLLR